MNIIFTDIDGVLNPAWKKQWSKKSIAIYNRICKDFNLLPVVTSTWRVKHTKQQLQAIFIKQGITATIYDCTPVLNDSRGIEIDQWLRENNYSKYVVIDDSCREIKPYVQNVIEVRGWIGLEEEHYDQIKKIIIA
jgi:Swiss Army Knife RNA repair-like protein